MSTEGKDRAARALDGIFAAACDKALANARNEALVRANKMCVTVLIPLRFRAADIGSAAERLTAGAPQDAIKKIAPRAWPMAHRCIIEPYQSLVPEGPNYLPPKRGAS